MEVSIIGEPHLEPLIETHRRNLSKKSGWTWPIVLAGVVSCLGLSVPVGYSIGNINTPSDILKAWCNESIATRYDISMTASQLDILWSSVVSIFLIGGMAGSLSGALVADLLGRKGGVVVAGGLQLASGVLYLSTKPLSSVELLLLARLICGLASGLTTGVIPMYLMELSPPSLKGAMGVLCPLGVTAGVLFGQIVGLPFLLGTEELWHILLSFYSVLVLLAAVTLPWLVESPKYLYAIKKDRQAAIKVLARIRCLAPDCVVGELEDSSDCDAAPREKWSILKLLSTPPLLLNLALVTALQAGQQVSGINAVFYYSVEIFKSVGLSLSAAQYASLGAGAINLGMAALMIPVVNTLPRRLLAVTSCSLSVLFLLLLTVAMLCKAMMSWMSFLAVISLLGYVLVYGLGLGPIPYFIGSELFDVGPRPAAMALGSVANWTGNFLVGMTFPLLNRTIGAYSFLIFAAFTFLLTTFLYFCLPETNYKVLTKRKERTEINYK